MLRSTDLEATILSILATRFKTVATRSSASSVRALTPPYGWLLAQGTFRSPKLQIILTTNAYSVPKYAALKIAMAKSSLKNTESAILTHLTESASGDPSARHVTAILDKFQHEGPNGLHQCLVFEIMGDSVASLVENIPGMRQGPLRYPKPMAKKILLHALRGLAFVHKHGVVHGDVQPGNMLFSVRNMDDIDEQQLKQHEAETAVPVERMDGKTDKWAPSNMYTRESLHEYVELGADLCVKLGDFGACKLPYNDIETS